MDSYTHDGLTFEVDDRGEDRNGTVVALHGFPEDRRCWEALADALGDDGYRTVAPDQRGYSPLARPVDRRDYRVGLLAGDVLALLDDLGADRVHLVGHDWGAVVAWHLAANRPDRVRTLTALSVPHPAAVRRAAVRGGQLLRSWYMLAFQLPRLPEMAMARHGGRDFAERLVRSGLDVPTAERYALRAATPGTMTGPLNWYRAIPFDGSGRMGKVSVPTLFCWGTGDGFVSRRAAELCGGEVVGSYRFAALEGASHWLPERSTDEVVPLMEELLATDPGRT